MAQSQRTYTKALLLLAVSGLFVVAPVSAQDLTEATAESRAQGLGSGKIRFHPSLTLEMGYDTNIFYQDANENPVAAPVLGVRPEIGVATFKPTNVDFNLKGGVFFQYYLSDDKTVTEQSGLDGNASASITFNPNGAVAFRLRDNFVRTNEAPNSPLSLSYHRIVNNAGAALIIQPGGKILTGELGGRAKIARHSIRTSLDKNEFGADLEFKWKFLPKTALILDTSWDFIFYDESELAIPGQSDGGPQFTEPFQGGTVRNVNSQPLRLRAGVKGLLLNRVSVTLLGGYGQGFYDSGADFKGFIGVAEFGYEIGPTSRFVLGYRRDFQDTTVFNYFTDHGAYLRYNHLFGGRFDLTLEGAFVYREYSAVPQVTLPDVTVDGVRGTQAFPAERVDPMVTGDVDGVFFITDFFTAGLKYNLAVNSADFVQITGIGPTGSATAQYVKHRVFLTTGVRW